MFQSAMSALSSTIVGAAKNTASAYRPSNALKSDGAFDRLAQQGIANLSYRSPVMANLAETMLQNVRLEIAKKERIAEYIKTDNSKDFRSVVGNKLGGKASGRDIDQEMSRILNKISRSIDSSGEEETKKSVLFKEYEKYFNEFKNSGKTTPTNNDVSGTPNDHSVGSELEHSSILHKIESNTQRTYNAIEELVTQKSIGGVEGKGSSGHSFIDPMTGMPSIRAAIGSIGGSFLSKVFDEETINRFAKKAKTIFGVEEDAELRPAPHVEPKDIKSNVDDIKAHVDIIPSKDSVPQKYTKKPGGNEETISKALGSTDLKLPTPKKSGLGKSIDDILGNLSLDLTHDIPTDINNLPQKDDAPKDIKSNVDDRHFNVASESLSELKKINTTLNRTEPSKKLGKQPIREGATNKVLREKKNKITKTPLRDSVNTTQTPITNNTPTAKSGVLSDVIGAATSATGAAAMIPAIAAAAPWVLGAAAVGAVGYGAYKMLSNDGSGKYEPVASNGMSKTLEKYSDKPEPTQIQAKQNSIPKIEPFNQNLATEIEKLSGIKDKQIAASSTNQTTPIIVGGQQAQAASPTISSPNIMVTTSVRNMESTFERVQMQDFWSRTA